MHFVIPGRTDYLLDLSKPYTIEVEHDYICWITGYFNNETYTRCYGFNQLRIKEISDAIKVAKFNNDFEDKLNA